jgi:hypothetical protein
MKRRAVLGSVMLVCVAGLSEAWAAEKPRQPRVGGGQQVAKSDSAKPETKQAKIVPAVQPKPLLENVNRGLEWLAAQQLKNGGWGQGEESAQMGGGAKLKDIPSVADTCVAALALVRAGNTPSEGKHAKEVLNAVTFLCGEIEESDKDSLYVTSARGTRVQSKLGPYIDTFLAAMLLPEVKDRMPTDEGRKRVAAALDKVLGKIQKNQRQDGTWGGEGWATTIQQGMAVKGLNRAAQYGAAVDEKVRARAEAQARKSFDRASGKFSEAGSAGVQLYAAGSSLGSVAESVKTNKQREAKLEQQLASPSASAPEKAQAQATLKRYKAAEADLADAEAAVVAKLDDQRFIAGFGSNGGEEFLSYMNIGESLVVKGGDAWKAWDKSITENLNRVQNSDGSWSGHHCITGRTFCTSAALLVLMVDRSPAPIAEKMRQRQRHAG